MIPMLLSQWEMNSLLLIDRPLTTAVLENHLLTAPPRPRWRVIGCYWREMGCKFVCLYLLMLVNASDLLSRILETWLLNWGSHKNRSAPPWVYSFFFGCFSLTWNEIAAQKSQPLLLPAVPWQLSRQRVWNYLSTCWLVTILDCSIQLAPYW